MSKGDKKLAQKNFAERYQDISNSTEFRKRMYSRRLMGFLTFAFIILFMIPAYLVEKIVGISGYITCTIAGIAAISVASFIAEKKAAKKFEQK